MEDEKPKAKVGLVLKTKQPPSTSSSLATSAVFGDDSDDEESRIAKETDAGKKFHLKYGSNKARDERAVAEVLAADPLAYEYDSIHDEIERQRNSKREAQREADKDKKPKYAHNLIHEAKKRELAKLLVDERKQDKERAAEGDEFADKDTFVTGAYKKQIEEREQMRRELLEQERLDNRLKVEDQEFWQANFHRRYLDEMTRGPVIDVSKVKIKTESETDAVKEEPESELPSSTSKKRFEDLKPGLNKPKIEKSKEIEAAPEKDCRRRRRDDDRDRTDDRHRDHDRHRHRSSRHGGDGEHRRRSESKRESEKKEEKPKDEKTILKERFRAIKNILKQRNDASAIFMATQRYLQRKANGEIKPPSL